MDKVEIQKEVDENYKFFQASKDKISEENSDKFVLIRHKKFIDFYTTKEDAITAGKSQFSDDLFSVQKVEDDIIDLGLVGYALP